MNFFFKIEPDFTVSSPLYKQTRIYTLERFEKVE